AGRLHLPAQLVALVAQALDLAAQRVALLDEGGPVGGLLLELGPLLLHGGQLLAGLVAGAGRGAEVLFELGTAVLQGADALRLVPAVRRAPGTAPHAHGHGHHYDQQRPRRVHHLLLLAPGRGCDSTAGRTIVAIGGMTSAGW